MIRWRRADHHDRLRSGERFDVLVVGGGIVGAGVAQDAAGRGLSVALVDRSDFGGGTSGRSTKLLHGGIRYMARLRFGLVRQGLREQVILERTADHLYEPLRFVIPIYRGRSFADAPRWARHPLIFPLALRIGLLLYDLMGGRLFGKRRAYRASRIKADEALLLAPRLRPDGLKGAFLYYDAQTDDARLTLACAATAVADGAVAVNWMEVESVEPDGDGYRAALRDRQSGAELVVHARTVVAATGPFAPPAPPGNREALDVVKSKGVHLVADLEELGLGTDAVVLPETDDRRIMYVIPWQGHAIVGTTDTAYDGDLAHPTSDEADAAYVTRHLRQYFDIEGLEPISAWAGLRALVDTGSARTSEASREHRIVEIAPGYVQVAGGKLTGYRLIAAEVVDGVAAALNRPARSTTDHQPLAGAGATPATRAAVAVRIAALGLEPGYGDLLHRRYGLRAGDVVSLLEGDERLRRRLGDGSTLAEAAYAARHESVTRISDFTLRRTRLSWFTKDHGRDDAPAIAAVLAVELDWDDEEQASQLAAFEAELVAEGL